jgi:hypothetical protein
MEAGSHLIPAVGEAALERVWEHEAAYIDAMRAGTAECPGFTPISKFMRKAVKFFDGQAGLNFIDSNNCHNPAKDSEARQNLNESRERFDELLKQARKAH